MLMHTIYFVSLGCDKNRVDSEYMLALLDRQGFVPVDDPREAEAAVINTCAFVLDAQEESVETILEFAEYKQTGKLKVLIVAGCMAQRFQDEIREEVPEVDVVLGASSYDKIAEAALAALGGAGACIIDDPDRTPRVSERMVSTPPHYAYLKIAEGCAKRCTYCIIPYLRGSYRSVPMEELACEARTLAARGTKELILVAQETTLYGIDLYGEKKLPQLLRLLSQTEGIEWIRLLYCYPEEITEELITEIRENPKVCHYLDLPIQHMNDSILRRMGRRATGDGIRALIGHLRSEIPDIVLRTTLIAGFPGETQQMHDALLEDLEEVRFDRLGVFPYSPEDGTPAASFPDQVDEEMKNAWADEIMALQQDLIFEENERLTGTVLDVMIDGYLPEEGVYVGRSYRDTPDVDGLVFAQSDRMLMSGDRIKVLVTDANGYDLKGVEVHESAE